MTYDPSSRTVRIFISSTFRDFAAERDILVRKVFPELRRRCRERQVELIDIDLRWGITEEEAQQGRVLPICMAEIDRARPFFMGLLGERYGWVPAAGQFDRSLLIEQPWLEEHAGGKSVTELEILHGVLNNRKMAGRAFFYFRAPAWSAAQGPEYVSGNGEEAAKLAALKDRIRESVFPVMEDYHDPDALADRVREDLWKLIDDAYPESDLPDTLTLERRRHEAYGGSRRRLYLGGDRYFEALDVELASESPRPVLVRGRSGGGKSALLANWLAHWSPAHPDTAVIVHHLGCGTDATDPVRLAVRIMQEIALLAGEEFKPTTDPDEQLDELAKWLATASAWAERTDRAVLIVLDGLDKLADRRHLRWFPTALPPGVRLVASCLDGDVIEAAQPRLPWREIVVEPFTPAEQTKFIGEYLGRFRKQLTTEQARILQAHPLVGNPLFLLTVLEELRVFGVHEELDQRLATLLSPPPSKQPGEDSTVDDVFEHVLARIEVDYGTEPVQRLMESLWASRAGLYTDELLEIANVPPATWAGIANALDESLYESSGRINFGHDYLRKAVEDRYSITDEARLALHRRLAEHFASREVDARVAEELPWQWREAHDKRSLEVCLTHLALFEAIFWRDEYELVGYWLWLGVDPSNAYEMAIPSLSDAVDTQLDRMALVAHFLTTAGSYSDFSASLHREILRTEEASLGPDHADTLVSANDCAGVLIERAEYDAAAALLRRVLDARIQTLGSAHPDTLASLNNLGVLLTDQSNYEEAERLLRQAVSGRESVLGLDNILTLHSVHNLANLLRDQGDYPAAEVLYRRAVDGKERTLGPDNPDTLASVNGLANLLSDQGEYSAAEALYRRALRGREKVLGPDHPDTLASVNNLAVVLSDQGDFTAAETLYRRVLAGQETSLGPGHPDTLGSVNNLAAVLRDLGEYSASEALYRRALTGREKLLGPDHSDTLASLDNLANLLSAQGDYSAAADLHRRALEAREKLLGPDHSDTLSTVNDLAGMLRMQGDVARAEIFFRQALDGRERTLGSSHPLTLSSVNNMAIVLIDKGEHVAAEPLCRRALEGRERALGLDHPDTLASVARLGDVLHLRGDHTAAEHLYRRALDGCEDSIDIDNPLFVNVLRSLVRVLLIQDKLADAHGPAKLLLAILVELKGPAHPDTVQIASAVAALSTSATSPSPRDAPPDIAG